MLQDDKWKNAKHLSLSASIEPKIGDGFKDQFVWKNPIDRSIDLPPKSKLIVSQKRRDYNFPIPIPVCICTLQLDSVYDENWIENALSIQGKKIILPNFAEWKHGSLKTFPSWAKWTLFIVIPMIAAITRYYGWMVSVLKNWI